MAIEAKSTEVVHGTITDTFDMEEMIEDIRSHLNLSMEYAESSEPLQARQSFGEAKARMEELERFIETFPVGEMTDADK